MSHKVAFILSLIISTFTTASAVQLQNFDDLYSSLLAGLDVKVVAYYEQCSLDGQPGPKATGGALIDTWEYFEDLESYPFLAFSHSVLIVHNRYGTILDKVRFKFNSLNQVFINAQYLDPVTYELKMNETFVCKIGISKNVGGVYLFSS
eukprot:TRINITY_DN1218_c0_g3_i1.p1 TRINITY_DN1218_c0_g3~~TRINITY_DN1218_c0_g3_i1.p1  ORF type:complete len:161 (-),score=14.27 TRINITY_DN1218_c0_g3_i1:36-482(-)